MMQPHLDKSDHRDRYVVIGNPISHSKSPEIHNRFAQQTGQPMHYETLLAPLDGFEKSVTDFILAGGRGANVTLPFKLQAHALATQLSARARAAGAVNTLHFKAGEIIGDNTDGVGLVRDITHNAQFSLMNKRVLLLGAGGAARGALQPLLLENPHEISVVNRTFDKAKQLIELAKQWPEARNQQVKLKACTWSDLRGKYDLIINATSASLSGDVPPITGELFSEHTLAYDMMYADQPTSFLRFAAMYGAQTRDGLGMLVEQAAEAFALWRGVQPATQEVLKALRLHLGKA